MTDYHDIYQTGAERYDRLVSREDYEGNIQKSLSQLIPLKGQSIVELGCGTGRLTTLLAQLGQQVFAFDASLAMLEVAE